MLKFSWGTFFRNFTVMLAMGPWILGLVIVVILAEKAGVRLTSPRQIKVWGWVSEGIFVALGLVSWFLWPAVFGYAAIPVAIVWMSIETWLKVKAGKDLQTQQN